ncbi:MAG: alpha-glucuronidase family glycosyl hydrolase, partial [Candidatus Hydrogenedentes bacterium]|nr:alpha-glucuronidase family glycosyl hydrolase [Candidatus Hydrogenedentota bacterium]
MKVLRAGFFCCVAMAVSGVAAAAVPDVYITPRAGSLERQAALELQRYLYAVLHDLPRVEVVENVPQGSFGFVVGTPENLPGTGLAYPFGLDAPSGDGYVLRTISEGRRSLVVVAGPTPKGVLNGVYGLLEEMGCVSFRTAGGLALSRTGSLRGIAVDMNRMPDVVP